MCLPAMHLFSYNFPTIPNWEVEIIGDTIGMQCNSPAPLRMLFCLLQVRRRCAASCYRINVMCCNAQSMRPQRVDAASEH